MLTCADGPKTLRSSEERAARIAKLNAPHMVALTDFVQRIRQTLDVPDHVPFFDPCDGGTSARALFLLEAPGPKAKASGFVSRNNPDQTAKNLFELHRDAGLSRNDAVLWNVVPWYVGSDTKIRSVDLADLLRATPYLKELLALLPNLQVVVLVGRKAQAVQPQLADIPQRVYASAHPSPVPMTTNPNTRDEILRVWKDVATFLRSNAHNAV